MCVYCLTFREKGSMQWRMWDWKASSQSEWTFCVFSKFSLSLKSLLIFPLVREAALTVINPYSIMSCCVVSFIMPSQSYQIYWNTYIVLTYTAALFSFLCFHHCLVILIVMNPFCLQTIWWSFEVLCPSSVHAEFNWQIFHNHSLLFHFFVNDLHEVSYWIQNSAYHKG